MFKVEELQVLFNLLNRVTINGGEAESVVYLKNKIKDILAAETAKPAEEVK